MSHCQICLSPGHEAWTLPSGRLVCPMKIEDQVKRATVTPRTNSIEFTMSIPEALALRAVLTRLGQTPSMLHPDTPAEVRALWARLWAVEPVTPAGNCACARPTRGMSSFHCGDCGKVIVYPIF